MLQKLNERIQGLVAWLVVILIAITFTLFGVDYYMQSRSTIDAKVIVNGTPIPSRTFENYYRRVRSQQEYSQLNHTQDKKLQEQILNQLVSTEATVQSAHQYGFAVSAQQANAAILRIPQFQHEGHFSAEKYQQALSSASFTPETFKQEVQQGILLNQQRFTFIASSFALPDEINRFVRLYLQTRDYAYLLIPAKQFESNAPIDNKAITNYYKKHKQEFKSPEQVSIDYILLSTKDIRGKIQISEEDIKTYYAENKNNFMTPAQWKVAHILFSIPEGATAEQQEAIKQRADDIYTELQKNPQKFETFVASTSDDKLSVPAKGELPWLTAGQSEFDSILVQLNTPNQISKPEKSKQGYEIFKVIEYKPSVLKPYNQVSQIIKEQFINEKAQTKFADALEKMTDLSYQTPDSLDTVSEALNLPVKHSDVFSKAGGADDFTKNKHVIEAAFSHDVMELGNNSEPLQIDNDSVAVLRVNKAIPSKIEEFKEVQSKIKAILAKEYATKKASEIGTLLLSPAPNAHQQELIKSYNLKWISVTAASRDNDKGTAVINDLAFNLLKPDSRDGMTLTNGDYVVVKLEKVNDGSLSTLDPEQRDSLVQQIESSYGMMDYDLYVKSLVKKAEVVKTDV